MRLLAFILLVLPLCMNGQNRMKGWKAHVSFNPVIQLAGTPDFIVAATGGGLIFTDWQGTNIKTFTKAEGLSEAGISAIAYSQNTNILLIGYKSGNLDLIQDEQIYNLPDLTRKVDLPDKNIHRIFCEGDFAYLCCAFGIVKIDLKRRETAETWYLGPTYNQPEAFDLISFMDSWWIASSRGILKAEKKNSNLQDYRNWQLQTSLPQPDDSFSSLAQYNGMLYSIDVSSDRIYAYNGINWQQKFPEIKNFRNLRVAGSALVILAKGEVWLSETAGLLRIDSYSGSNSQIDPRDAMISSGGELWIGDYRYGLTRRSGTSFLHIVPDSPCSDQITALKAGPENIFAATVYTGTEGIAETTYSILESGQWQNFTADDDPELKSTSPITSFAFPRKNTDEYWASSSGSGLLFFKKNRLTAKYNEANSAMGAINGLCTVNSISLDDQNNLWYTNPTGTDRLGTRSANGAFKPLSYPGMSHSLLPTGEIITGSQGIKWVVLPDEGLFAFKSSGGINVSDDLSRKIPVQSRFSNGSSTVVKGFSEISAVAEDRNSQLWVGTGTGIVVYGSPEKVFDPGEFYGIQPSIDDGEQVFKPILEKEKVTAIAIDGGNRKWIGTAHSGVFLFSENGDHLVQHFNSKNSPLLSDEILYIAISSLNGEVFFATTQGLVSYKSDATPGETNLDKSYVWPNPLRETFDGEVTIDGLTEGTLVKITDLTGSLIYQTTSIGGRAVWNARNANGARVSTGVYLIFCSSPQTKVSKILKLLVIH
jgi:ligand-binding sensor domain-containing protein